MSITIPILIILAIYLLLRGCSIGVSIFYWHYRSKESHEEEK